MTELKPVSSGKDDMKWIKELFISAFPRNERPPFFVMRKFRNNRTWLKILEDGKNAGFIYLITNKDLVYIFFFAVKQELRGKGIGSRALKKVLEEYKDYRVFLAAEDPEEEAPNHEERIRRIEFYRRCGLESLNRKMRELNVVYVLLGSSSPPENAEYLSLLNGWAGFRLTAFFKTEIYS